MTDGRDAASQGLRGPQGIWALGGLAGLLAAIELILWLGPGVAGLPPNLRTLALEYGAFWPGLLGNWRPNFPQQPWVMFVTYGFLHAGPVHLVVNLITLISLGRMIVVRAGTVAFAVIYLTSMIGGAVGFALLATGPMPMVGASGALFGLAGAILAWDFLDRYSGALSLWPVVRAVAFLLVLNLVLWWAMAGLLAWQTHLGGFVVGWAVAMLVDRFVAAE